MNYNKHNQNASSPNNQRRQKTIPLSAANNMKPPPAYAQNQMNGTNMNHMNQYNPSPRNIPHRKSPRSKNKKNKKGKLPDNPATHRGRSHTTGHNVLNTQQMANANSPISAISPISPNGPTQPYMTMPPPPQNQPPRSTGNTPHNRKVSPMGNRNHNPHMNQWGPPQHPLQQNHNPNAIYNPQQHMYNNNPSLTNNQFPNHNATGTMIQHMNQGTHPDVPNLYDDRSSGSNNVIPNSTSHPTSLHQGATLYQSRSECVWSIHLFEQTEVASKFQCETCRDVPRKGFAFTSDQQTGVYCEYCIDLKVRQGMDIQHKTRLPIMVQNMIDKLKVKCPRYAQCKHKGTVHGLVEHLKVCNQIKGKKKSGAQAKQCPLEYMGCVEFTGGYLKEHYDEYQQEHFDFVIAFFENKLHKFETQLTMKLTETQTEIAQLKAENVELKNEIVTLNTAKEHLSSELVDIRQSLSEMKQQQSVVIHAPVQIEENNPYKIVVNEAAKEAHSKQSQHTQNSDREHGNWNSFLNAHRRLSTKTGATIPDTQQTENAAAGAGAMVHGNYAGQLLSNPQSFNTQQSSSYASSMRSETASEGWFHKLPNHPLLNELGKQSNHNNSNNNRSKLQQNIGSAASEERVMKPNRNLQQQQSHCTGDTHTEHRYEEEDIHDDDDETLMDDTFDDEATHTTAATDTTSVRNERIMAKIKDMKKKGRIKSSAEFQYIQIAKINNKKKKKKKSNDELMKVDENSPTASYPKKHLYIESVTGSVTSYTDSAVTVTDSDYHFDRKITGDESKTNMGPSLNMRDIDEAPSSLSTPTNSNLLNPHQKAVANLIHSKSSSSVSPPSPPQNVASHDQQPPQAITPWAEHEDTYSEYSMPEHGGYPDVDHDVQIYDDATTVTDAVTNNNSNYSCTISVRRAIQHLVPNYYDDAKQMELPLSDQKMVVIDIGSQLSKVGTAGSNKPAVIFQSMVAKHKLNGSRAIGSLTGNNKLTNYACSYPVDRGVIKNYDEWESIVHCIFYDKLQINPKEYNALMVEPILSPKKQSLKILQICFDKFDLNALFLAQDALCALYASGGNTGLSVSSGHGLTTVVPIYEGYVIPHAAQKLNFAGGDINSFLKEKLNLHGLFRSQLSENKFADSLKQKLAYVATDYQLEKQHTMFERIVYRLPDGSEIEVGQERFECAESLFDGRSILNKRTSNTKKTVADLVNQALTHASDDIRQVLFENIVCSGGNTMLKGFDERLKKEVDANAPDNSGWKTRVFGLVDRKLSCWIGGSIMASLSHMDQLWITRKQYQECGPNIINRTSY
eukprot:1078708_1